MADNFNNGQNWNGQQPDQQWTNPQQPAQQWNNPENQGQYQQQDQYQQQGQYQQNYQQGQYQQPYGNGGYQQPYNQGYMPSKSRTTFGVLALLIGGLGVQYSMSTK